MALRNILDWQGKVIGALSLPDKTSEASWEDALSIYAIPPMTEDEKAADDTKEVQQVAKDFSRDLNSKIVATFEGEGFRKYDLNYRNQVVATLLPVFTLLSLGMALDAIDELRSLPEESYDDIFVTPDRLLWIINAIEVNLGLDASKEL